MINYAAMCDKVTVLQGYAELLMGERPPYGPATPKQKEALREMLKAAEELLEIVRRNRPPRPDADGSRGLKGW